MGRRSLSPNPHIRARTGCCSTDKLEIYQRRGHPRIMMIAISHLTCISCHPCVQIADGPLCPSFAQDRAATTRPAAMPLSMNHWGSSCMRLAVVQRIARRCLTTEYSLIVVEMEVMSVMASDSSWELVVVDRVEGTLH